MIISEREKRTIAIGAAVSVVALLLAFVVLPFVRRERDREELIALRREQLERLQTVLAKEKPASTSERWLTARTPGLASSALQSLLRTYADQSSMVVSELDVTGEPDTAGATLLIPAKISAIGELPSVTKLLSYIEHGLLVLQIREMSLRPNPALKGQLLQLSVTLRAPFVSGETRTQALSLDTVVTIPRNVFFAAAEAPAPPPMQRSVERRNQLELFGIVMGNEPTALMRLEASGTQVYREGDVGGGYRVVKISASSVELMGPAGRMVLRLKE